MLPKFIHCKHCSEHLELNEQESQARSYHCPSCEKTVDLTEEGSANEYLVTIATYMHPYEAHIALAKLHDNNIFAVVADELIVVTSWNLANAVGGVKMQVDEADVMKSLQVLQEKNESSEDSAHEEGYHCPQCGADQSKVKRKAAVVNVMLGFIAFGSPLPLSSYKYTCGNCQHQWKTNT